MDNAIVAVFIQEGSHLISEFLKNRSPSQAPTQPVDLENYLNSSMLRFKPYLPAEAEEPKGQEFVIEEEEPPQKTVINIKKEEPLRLAAEKAPESATAVATGCIPCSLGHVGTCTGLLEEAVRFSHTDAGIAAPEVIDRVSMCLNELNTMERGDMNPEKIVQLHGWERDLAERVLTESRNTRHALENLANTGDVNALEELAASTATTRKEIGREWFQNKLKTLSPSDQDEVKRRVMAKIEEMAATEATE